MTLRAVSRHRSSPRQLALALLFAFAGCLNPLPEEYPSEADSAPIPGSTTSASPPDGQSAEAAPASEPDSAPANGDAGADAGVGDAGAGDAGEPDDVRE